jgi:hypothetical protein
MMNTRQLDVPNSRSDAVAWRLRDRTTAGVGTIVDVDVSQNLTGLNMTACSESTAKSVGFRRSLEVNETVAGRCATLCMRPPRISTAFVRKIEPFECWPQRARSIMLAQPL